MCSRAKRYGGGLTLAAAVIILCLQGSGPTEAGKPVGSVPFKATFRTTAAMGTGDAITDDDGTAYVNGQRGVLAHFPETGNFVIDPDRNARKNDPKRYFQLFFAVSSGLVFPSDGAPVGSYYQAGFMSINAIGEACDESPLQLAPRDMSTTRPYNCIRTDVAVNFGGDVGRDLRLRCGENPYAIGGEQDPTGTDEIRVECLANGTDGKCKQWDIRPFVPVGSSQERLLCRLFEHWSGPAGHVTKPVADFNMPFAVVVERLQ